MKYTIAFLIILIAFFSCKKNEVILEPLKPLSFTGTTWEVRFSNDGDLSPERFVYDFVTDYDVLLTMYYRVPHPWYPTSTTRLTYKIDSINPDSYHVVIQGKLNALDGTPNVGEEWKDDLRYKKATQTTPETLGTGSPFYYRIK